MKRARLDPKSGGVKTEVEVEVKGYVGRPVQDSIIFSNASIPLAPSMSDADFRQVMMVRSALMKEN